jgi:hypothetical protein
VPASAAPGTYEVRLFAQGQWQRLAVSNTITVQPPTLTASPASVVLGETVTATWSDIGVPSTSDWVGLVPTGATDRAWVVWGYTTGTSSGSRGLVVPASAAPGTYEVRLFAQGQWQRLAVSNTVTVLPPALTASPSSVAPGGTVTATWSGIGAPSATDWVGLVPTGAADTAWVAWRYTTSRTTGGSRGLEVPTSLSPGTYELRLFAQGGWERLAVSNEITVTAPGPSLAASPVAAAPGGTLTVRWQQIAAPTATDWVGVYEAGAADASYVTRFYTSGRASDRTLIVLPDNLATGSYELRLFTNDTLTRLATSNPFAVASGPSVSVSPVAVAPGGTVTATWSGIGAPSATDWVGLVPTGAVDTAWVVWGYTTGTNSGSRSLVVPASATPGTYELRLFAQGGWERLAVSNLVTVGPTLALTPTPVAPGGAVTVTWAGVPTPTSTDAVALFPLNAPDTSYVAWVYLNGRAADSLLFMLPPTLAPGTYDARLFAQGGLQRLAISDVITVTVPGPTLAASPVTAAPGSTLTVDWHGIAAPTATDWIGVYASGTPDASYVTRVVTNGLASGTTALGLPGGLAVGSYELRLFSNNTFTRLAVSNGFSVAVAAPVVWVTPVTIAAGGTLTVTWQGIAAPTPTDWVGLVRTGTADTAWVAWEYTTGTSSGSRDLAVPTSLSPGTYELRLFAQGGWERLAVSNVVTVP